MTSQSGQVIRRWRWELFSAKEIYDLITALSWLHNEWHDGHAMLQELYEEQKLRGIK